MKPSSGDVVSQFEEAMTPEEKAKLYEAIDYQVTLISVYLWGLCIACIKIPFTLQVMVAFD